jgi:hypothetical protein
LREFITGNRAATPQARQQTPSAKIGVHRRSLPSPSRRQLPVAVGSAERRASTSRVSTGRVSIGRAASSRPRDGSLDCPAAPLSIGAMPPE